VVAELPPIQEQPKQKQAWGPSNPHPLSKMRAELLWDGKYDVYGNRRDVDLAGWSMPLQTIETIDQPRSEAAANGQLSLFNKASTRQDDFKNMLVWGDNKLVMSSLLQQFAGKIQLIYIDPPFDIGADFTMEVPVGEKNATVFKDQSTLEMVAYRDTWGRGNDSFMSMLRERLAVMQALLTETGSIFVHIGANINHLVRSLMDDVFGAENFRNEIILPGRAVKNLQQQFDSIQKLQVRHDCLLWYTKSSDTRFAPCWIDKHNTGNPAGHWHHFWSTADRPTMRYELFGITPTSGQWVWKEERALKAYANYQRFEVENGGRTLAEYWRDTGSSLEFIRKDDEGKPCYWRAPAEMRLADTVWSGIPIYSYEHGYPTEKSQQLIQQILELASKEDDLIADFFCGSGTTPVVAEKLHRRWIACDLGRFAIHMTRKRLIETQRILHADAEKYRAFAVYNLGRYERQWWQKEKLQGADEEHRRVVLAFYRAETLDNSPSPLLHGRKAKAFVSVDGIDSLLTREELTDTAAACAEAGGKEVHCLAWEFEMDLKLHAQSLEKQHGIVIKLIMIPREIMERNRIEPPPFLEVAELEVEPIIKKVSGEKIIEVKLKRFLPSLAEVPLDELEKVKNLAIKSGFDFIDFWSVDFDYHDDVPFNHQWQTFRTKRERHLALQTEAGYKYVTPGKHSICVKVIDVFGVDTTVVTEIEV